MKNFSTWLIVLFMIMFWVFRVIITLCSQLSIDLLGLQTYNLNLEIILLFVTILCILLVIKRNIIGSLLYLLVYGSYFGEHLFTTIVPILQKSTTMTMETSLNLFMDFIAIILALFALFDTLLDKQRKANPIDKKTDWYFNNQKYDDELNARDKREDKNEYKYY